MDRGNIHIMCRMTPEEAVDVEWLIQHDGFRSRNKWLRSLILREIEIAKEIDAERVLTAAYREGQP